MEVGRDLGVSGCSHGAWGAQGKGAGWVPCTAGTDRARCIQKGVYCLLFFLFSLYYKLGAPWQCPGLAVPSSHPSPAGGPLGVVASPCRVRGAGAVGSIPSGCQGPSRSWGSSFPASSIIPIIIWFLDQGCLLNLAPLALPFRPPASAEGFISC